MDSFEKNTHSSAALEQGLDHRIDLFPQLGNLAVSSSNGLENHRNQTTRHLSRSKQLDLISRNDETTDLVGRYLDQICKVPLLKAEQEAELSKQIEAGLYAVHLLETCEDLCTTQIADLSEVARQGAIAKEHMILANMRLVASIAKLYSGKGVPYPDMIQEGTLGLIRAVEKFDYKKGFKFSTYATTWIKKMLQVGLSENDHLMRVPYRVYIEIGRLEKITRNLEQQLGHYPSIDQIAQSANLTAEKTTEILNYSFRTISLDTPLSDEKDSIELADLICDDDATLENQYFQKSLHTYLEEALDSLSDLERQTILMEYGLFDGIPKTHEKIARISGYTKAEIKEASLSAIIKLRSHNDLSGINK